MRAIPDNVKQMRGTSRKDRAAESLVIDDLFAPLTKMPPEPEWLNVHALNYWRKVMPRLIKADMVTEGDTEAIEIMCLQYGKIRMAEIAGAAINVASLNQLRMYQGEFGLTPAGRSRMQQRGPGADGAPRQGRFSKNRPRAR